MVRINQAWEMLKEPIRRAAVDRARTRSAGAAARVAADEGAGACRVTRPGPRRRPAAVPTRHPPSGHAGARAAGGAPPTWGFPGMADPGDADFRARPQYVSPNWTSGRSQNGHGYDPGTMGSAQGDGAAGPPPGNPSGSLLTFGRYTGWSLGEIARSDLEYLEWLDRMPIGRTYQAEIDGLLRSHRRRATAPTAQEGQRGLFRRR